GADPEPLRPALPHRRAPLPRPPAQGALQGNACLGRRRDRERRHAQLGLGDRGFAAREDAAGPALAFAARRRPTQGKPPAAWRWVLALLYAGCSAGIHITAPRYHRTNT